MKRPRLLSSTAAAVGRRGGNEKVFEAASAAALSASSSSSFSSLHHHQQQQQKKEVVGEKSDVVSDGMESIGACMTIGGRRRDDYWKKRVERNIIPWRGFAASSSSSFSPPNNENNNKKVDFAPSETTTTTTTTTTQTTTTMVMTQRGNNPYIELARLDKPIGIYLLAYPSLWSILLSSSTATIPPPIEKIATMTALFSAGAVLLRGAGCTINDIWDRKVDAKVERTKNRPIASGRITVPNAVAFLGAQLGLGSVVLYQLDFNTQILGLMSLPLVATYPLMKRVTNLPQLFLGFTFNWGALMGWTAITGGVLEAPALALYGSGVCWTMVYDTIYAHQDIEDDKKIGIKSSARLFEKNTKAVLSTCGVGAISGLLASGYLAGVHWTFYPLLVSTAGTHLFWQIYTVDLKNRKDCGDKFRSNQTYGGLVLSSILAAKVAEHVL